MVDDPSGSDPRGITPHRIFRAALPSANFRSYRADPRIKVANQEEFDAMRAHLAAQHAGVEVTHSFADPAGNVFDCVPIAQQPSLKESGAAVAEPPSLLDAMKGQRAAEASVAAGSARQLRPAPESVDRHGNSTRCPPGSIPVRRVTLTEMARFRTLRDYFSKSGAKPLLPGATVAPTTPVADDTQNHRYAYEIQTIDNLGAHNFLNVWAPTVGANQIFSLAQHWYSAGAGNGHQTLEVGWQVFPAKYNHNQPVLFIYWTADNYQHTGAYNLDAAGFVQTNPAWTIGGALTPVSTDGGTQYEIQVTVYLFQGNWWLYLGGITAADAVGYFPPSIYNGGAMVNHASIFECGGETVCSGAGTWPGMGSGAFASTGWQHAAYQRDIYVFPTSGGAQYGSLTGQQPSPACYTQALGNTSPPWNTYFFFGGPGGGNC
jgi:hypothetical protein